MTVTFSFPSAMGTGLLLRIERCEIGPPVFMLASTCDRAPEPTRPVAPVKMTCIFEEQIRGIVVVAVRVKADCRCSLNQTEGLLEYKCDSGELSPSENRSLNAVRTNCGRGGTIVGELSSGNGCLAAPSHARATQPQVSALNAPAV